MTLAFNFLQVVETDDRKRVALLELGVGDWAGALLSVDTWRCDSCPRAHFQIRLLWLIAINS